MVSLLFFRYTLPRQDSLQNKCQMLFSLCTFFYVSEDPLWIFSFSKRRYECRSFVKARWCDTNFGKAGDTCILYTHIDIFALGIVVQYLLIECSCGFIEHNYHE